MAHEPSVMRQLFQTISAIMIFSFSFHFQARFLRKGKYLQRVRRGLLHYGVGYEFSFVYHYAKNFDKSAM
ncbi:hypothetical protein DYG62_13855 [Yersinia enterocolitica]|nr:hypothetical protein [Yersinia enterocolitica]